MTIGCVMNIVVLRTLTERQSDARSSRFCCKRQNTWFEIALTSLIRQTTELIILLFSSIRTSYSLLYTTRRNTIDLWRTLFFKAHYASPTKHISALISLIINWCRAKKSSCACHFLSVMNKNKMRMCMGLFEACKVHHVSQKHQAEGK